MVYHGAGLHFIVAMKWTKPILLISNLLFLTFPGTLSSKPNVETFLAPAEVKTFRGATNVVYACTVGGETGPCVDEPVLCTAQGGKFVGYCFFQGQYEGVCCTGLNPANSTLTTTRKPPNPNDDSTSTPPPFTTQTLPPAPTMTSDTLPPAPTMTTQTLPPAPSVTSDTLPPAPTMTTQTMPPPPSMSTETLPPAPTMTTDTMPPAPTMTTQTMPPPPSMSTETLPPAPTMTTDTMPTAPTMTTQTMPPAPTMSTETLPPAPTMTTDTMPTAPTMSTQTLPPAPTFPTQSSSSGGVHDESSGPPAPSMPTAPTMSTQTLPPAPTQPTMTTQTMPPAPTQPTMTTQTLPPAPTQPTMTTPSQPSQPTMTTDTMPPAPTMTTQSMPTQPTMTTPSQPSQPTITTDTLPPAPTITTQSMPTQPTMTTQSLPTQPTMTTDTLPPAPTITTQSMPTQPTMTTQSLPTTPSETTPTAPELPSTPQTPSVPSVTPPQTPSPPSQPTQPPAQYDNSSSTHHTFFPTMSTQTFPTMSTSNQTMSTFTMTTQTFPEFNLTMTTQQMNFTTHAWNFTTEGFNFTTQEMNMTTHSFPNLTMTTEQMNFTTHQFNLTMSTQPMPNITGPHFPTMSTTEATTSEDTSDTTAATLETSAATDETPSTDAPPSFDAPHDGSGCGIVSTAVEANFRNPSYPGLDTAPNIYEYSVIPREGYCALRIDILETHLAGKGMEGCSTDSIVIINSLDSPTTPQCGLLEGYQYTVRQEQGQPVKIVVTTQSGAHLWNINTTQILCSSIRPYQELEAPDCGVKNPKPAPAGITFHNPEDDPKSINPTKLLRTKKKTFKEVIMDPTLAPARLLQSAVLNRDTNIKIVRGNETAVNEYPWQALLMVSGRPLCGASVIGDSWLVTAGHCVQLSLRYPLSTVLTVDLGDHDLRTTKETQNMVLRVSKIIPNVQNEGVVNDIALLKLATKIPFGKTIRPVCLPPPKSPVDTYAGQTGITTGWGRTEDSVISPVLREAEVPILSNEKCRQQWASVGEGGGSIIDSGMVCAGGGDVGPCNGDSGGPLVVEEDGKYRLVGLTSFGLLRGCAVSGVPSVFARLTSYVDWMALNMALT